MNYQFFIFILLLFLFTLVRELWEGLNIHLWRILFAWWHSLLGSFKTNVLTLSWSWRSIISLRFEDISLVIASMSLIHEISCGEVHFHYCLLMVSNDDLRIPSWGGGYTKNQAIRSNFFERGRSFWGPNWRELESLGLVKGSELIWCKPLHLGRVA